MFFGGFRAAFLMRIARCVRWADGRGRGLVYNGGMENLGLSSRAWVLWDNEWGRAVFDGEGAEVGREADTPMEVASLTKIMTAIVTLEKRRLEEEVTITPEMLTGLEEFAVIGLEAGQTVTVEDLLYATLLPSAGDAAQALAISTSGSIEAFVEVMNQRAEEFGMKNTHFSNPVGFDYWGEAAGGSGDAAGEGSSEEAWDASGGARGVEIRNYSTARDVARMLMEALRDKRFREIFETYEKELPSIGKVARKTFGQTGVIKGGKTGFTNAAGRCLASTAKIQGTEYILVTLGAPAETAEHLTDAEKVYAAVAEGYEPVRLAREGDVIARVPVERSPVKRLEFQASGEAVLMMPKGFRAEDLSYSFEGYKGRTAVWPDTGTGEPFGAWLVKYKGRQVYGQALTIWESCSDESAGRFCVEKPGFYGLGWMGLGVLVTLVLAGMTAREFWKMLKQQKGTRQRATAWLGVAMTLVSLAATGFMFWDCFRAAPELEVLQPEIERGAQEEEPPEEGSSGSEGEEPEPGESSGAAGSSGISGASGASGVAGGNCTSGFGNLMLINPNFKVDETFIAGRRGGLISVSQTYGIPEYHAAGNGDNLMMPEAAQHLAEMVRAYQAENPGHEIGTYSCFRARGTTCGRLCAATGTSDHHTGLTCDLIDLAYGNVLNTDDYPAHKEWQWLRANSYRYGFIDRFPEEWAGGSMAEPLNVDANGSTGLFETWHYRYVGVTAATEIATGKYNGGRYDSLEHYLKATGRVSDLKGGKCR